MTAPLTDRERALCREAAVEAVRLYCEEHLGPPNCDSAPNPDPAPEPQTVTTSGWTYRVLDGVLHVQTPDGWREAKITVADVRALASLLPKRELTDEIVRRAYFAWRQAAYLSGMEAIRAALLSVWDDIAAPAFKPQWWAVVTADGKSGMCFDTPDDAQEMARRWYATGSLRLVVALAEVPRAP